jgi:hypothetical protein
MCGLATDADILLIGGITLWLTWKEWCVRRARLDSGQLIGGETKVGGLDKHGKLYTVFDYFVIYLAVDRRIVTIVQLAMKIYLFNEELT